MKSSDSFNIPVIVFHPNTLQELTLLRNSLLQEKYKDFFPLYPLYGFFSSENFSVNLKSDFRKLNKASIEFIFEKKGILYFAGKNKTGLTHTGFKEFFFIIPAAINKKTDDKKLSSVFLNSIKTVSKFNLKPLIKLDNALTYKSFQIADCTVLNNDFSLSESFWVKVNS